MERRDPVDAKFLVFVIVMAIGLVSFGYTIFPHRDAPAVATPSAPAESAPSPPAATPSETPPAK